MPRGYDPGRRLAHARPVRVSAIGFQVAYRDTEELELLKTKAQLADLARFFPLAFQVSRVRSSGLKLTLQLLVPLTIRLYCASTGGGFLPPGPRPA